MKLGILTTNIGYHSRLLIEAGKSRGHKVFPIEIPSIDMLIDNKNIRINSQNTNLLDMDVILIRGMTSSSCLRVMLEALHNKGVHIIDERIASQYDNNTKLYTYLKLSEKKLPLPKTYNLSSPQHERLSNIVDKLNNKLPIIAKISSSSKGEGVFLIKSENDYQKLMKSLKERIRRTLLFQEYLQHDGDIRIIVIGYKAIGAMYRKKKESEYRSNIALGAKGLNYELTPDIEKLAVSAARAVNMEIAGVDIMISNDKPYILEVNRSPQFQGFLKATKIDIPSEIIKYCEKVKG